MDCEAMQSNCVVINGDQRKWKEGMVSRNTVKWEEVTDMQITRKRGGGLNCFGQRTSVGLCFGNTENSGRPVTEIRRVVLDWTHVLYPGWLEGKQWPLLLFLDTKFDRPTGELRVHQTLGNENRSSSGDQWSHHSVYFCCLPLRACVPGVPFPLSSRLPRSPYTAYAYWLWRGQVRVTNKTKPKVSWKYVGGLQIVKENLHKLSYNLSF